MAAAAIISTLSDELADLPMLEGRDVEGSVTRLAQMARGGHALGAGDAVAQRKCDYGVIKANEVQAVKHVALRSPADPCIQRPASSN